MFKIIESNLQLFADGGEMGMSAGIADGGAVDTAGSQYAADDGVSTDNSPQTDADLEAEYKSLISGRLKAVHEKNFEKQMGRRLKGKDKQIAELEAYKGKATGVLDELAIKYGLTDSSDMDALIKAAAEDSSFIEEYAIQHGVDKDTARQLIKAERITAEHERQVAQEQEQAEFQQQFNVWMQQAEQTQAFYPSFDFDYESTNDDTGEQFRRLLNGGVDVKTAYEVIHRNEMLGGAMQYAYNTAQHEMADARTSRNQRPRENGTSNQQASALFDDMSKLSLKEIKQIQAAVSRGENVNEKNFRSFIK